MSCLLCKEEIQTEGGVFCKTHTRAIRSLKNAYTVWTNAYGKITVSNYLDRVIKLPGTGQKSREVAQFMRENPLRWELYRLS